MDIGVIISIDESRKDVMESGLVRFDDWWGFIHIITLTITLIITVIIGAILKYVGRVRGVVK